MVNTHQVVLITGAAGRIGRALRAGLARDGRTLRLLDIAPIDPPAPGEDVEIVQASFCEPPAIEAACAGADAVIHLGGLAGEASWREIVTVNIDGTLRVLEAARAAHVPRFVLASSIHAAGFHTRDEVFGVDGGRGVPVVPGVPDVSVVSDVSDASVVSDVPGDRDVHDLRCADGLPADVPPRPDTFYGVGKAAVEALASLYHSRFGLDVTCLRIGAYRPVPVVPADLAVWLSPADAVRLFEAAITPRTPGFRTLWGISANTRRWWSAAENASIDYRPEDDAESHAAAVLAGGRFDPADPAIARVGGTFCTMPLGKGNLL